MSQDVFYKATRPTNPATDFYSGTVVYEEGKRVRPLPTNEERHLCGPGLLHAATVPAMSLVGGSWPCRLFEVTGRPVAGLNASHPYKAGFRQLTVVREVEAWQALGPNGREAAALIERARVLTAVELNRLAAAWSAARDAARDAVRDATWSAVRDAAWDATWSAVRDAAWDATWSAARALVVRDLISKEYFDALYGPWAKVIGS